MSADTTWPTMKRSVELGARFLIKKPLDANTMNNLWQHLDQKFQRADKIKALFPGWSYCDMFFFLLKNAVALVELRRLQQKCTSTSVTV